MSEYLYIAAVVTILIALPVAAAQVGRAMPIREVLKQIVLWLGIAVLLPLATWYGTNAVSPAPDSELYEKLIQRLAERINDAKDTGDKERLRDERDRLEHEQREAWRPYFRTMFWVAYPIGILAVVIGTFTPVQVVGSAVMYGGVATLTTACHLYWDLMDRWLRFGSLLATLAVLVGLGLWRFRLPGIPSAS